MSVIIYNFYIIIRYKNPSSWQACPRERRLLPHQVSSIGSYQRPLLVALQRGVIHPKHVRVPNYKFFETKNIPWLNQVGSSFFLQNHCKIILVPTFSGSPGGYQKIQTEWVLKQKMFPEWILLDLNFSLYHSESLLNHHHPYWISAISYRILLRLLNT